MNARCIRIAGMLFVLSVTLCAQEPLARLVQEAEKNNPQILAAGHAWRAATQVPSQASTLPDPQVTVQHLAVGSPRPFAGFSKGAVPVRAASAP